MKLEFDSYPLDVYKQDASKSLLKSISAYLPNNKMSDIALSETILSSFIKKASGVGLLSLIDSISIGIKGGMARNCLSGLDRKQLMNVRYDSSLLLKEAQFNLIATYCVTEYLCTLESGSWGNGVKTMGKALIGLLSLKNPLNVVAEDIDELSKKYEDICQVYHIAFLLNAFINDRQKEEIIKDLIVETLTKDSGGDEHFFSKKRTILFHDSSYKTLMDNIKKCRDSIIKESQKYDGLYSPFVKGYYTDR